MSIQPLIYPKLAFFESAEKFAFVPITNDSNVPRLEINRSTTEVTLNESYSNSSLDIVRDIYGIVGNIQLINGKYLILITKQTRLGDIFGHDVFQIDQVEIVPYNTKMDSLTINQKNFESQYLLMVETFFKTPGFYYSHSYDLSYTVEQLNSFDKQFFSASLFERSNPLFVWNRHLLQDFKRKEFSRFCLPIIHGFVSINQHNLLRKSFNWALVSRRCVNRAGARLFKRGIDHNGNVANFVETEQIVYTNVCTSFVQVRGSIPLKWNQYPNLRYKSPIVIENISHVEPFSEHVRLITRNYKSIFMINLISQKGAEGSINSKFEMLVDNYNNLNYTPLVHLESFDFHRECKKDWSRLTVLMNNIRIRLNECEFFVRIGDQISKQHGIVRTNCIDSLDRTNVVQNLCAMHMLGKQLQTCGVLPFPEMTNDHPEFIFLYRGVWVDNADFLSRQYAGTKALKSDFTRTGKRSFDGLLADGMNSMKRYFKNNFEDGFRQDSINLILGDYLVNPSEDNGVNCPLKSRKLLKIYAFPLAILVALLSLIIILLLPSEFLFEKLYYLLFWLSFTVSGIMYLLHFKQEFVDLPTLVPMD